MKVLLVEDHPGIAKVSCELLRSVHGHEVEHVATGKDALAYLRTSAPDLVLIDLSLPDMHGYRVVEKARDLSHLKDTTWVALTGYGLTGDSERSRAVGIDHHFRKPMDFAALTSLRKTVCPDAAKPAV